MKRGLVSFVALAVAFGFAPIAVLAADDSDTARAASTGKLTKATTSEAANVKTAKTISAPETAVESVVIDADTTRAASSKNIVRPNIAKPVTKRTPTRVVYVAPEDLTKEDCATKITAALDKGCFNAATIGEGGVYADCNEKTISDLYLIIDEMLVRMTPADEVRDVFDRCSPYKSYSLTRWLGNRNIVETSAMKSSSACVLATKKLTSAKKCYTTAIAHDGNMFEFSRLMTATCGEYSDVARSFAKAGDMPLSNIPKAMENLMSGQFTTKSAGWRNAVEAVLAGYIYEAQANCGEGDEYEVLELNHYQDDSRENLLTIAHTEYAKTLAIRAAGGGTSSTTITTGGSVKAGAGKSQTIANIYEVEADYPASAIRARLNSIVVSASVGSPGTRDALDVAVLSAIGARVGDTTSAVIQALGAIGTNDAFVVRGRDGCQYLKYSGGKLADISAEDVAATGKLSSYAAKCAR